MVSVKESPGALGLSKEQLLDMLLQDVPRAAPWASGSGC